MRFCDKVFIVRMQLIAEVLSMGDIKVQLSPLNKWEGIDRWVFLVRFCMFSPVCWPDY